MNIEEIKKRVETEPLTLFQDDYEMVMWLIGEVEHLTNQSRNIKEQNRIIVDENRKLREHNKCLQKSLDMFVKSAELRAAGII